MPPLPFFFSTPSFFLWKTHLFADHRPQKNGDYEQSMRGCMMCVGGHAPRKPYLAAITAPHCCPACWTQLWLLAQVAAVDRLVLGIYINTALFIACELSFMFCFSEAKVPLFLFFVLLGTCVLTATGPFAAPRWRRLDVGIVSQKCLICLIGMRLRMELKMSQKVTKM